MLAPVDHAFAVDVSTTGMLSQQIATIPSPHPGLSLSFIGAAVLASPWDTDTASALGVVACSGPPSAAAELTLAGSVPDKCLLSFHLVHAELFSNRINVPMPNAHYSGALR